MKCVACLQGFTWECQFQGHCDEPLLSANVEAAAVDPMQSVAFGTSTAKPTPPAPVNTDPDPESFRTYKDDSVLVDQQSTGRKRAAKMYPLNQDAPCEWQQQKNCGGGKNPITGCTNGLQQARHHGSDKDTLNNEKGNVHRICHNCHARWHTLNDDGYVWGGIHEPHNPSPATIIELAESEMFWKDRKLKHVKD